jgi:hypothetical protein
MPSTSTTTTNTSSTTTLPVSYPVCKQGVERRRAPYQLAELLPELCVLGRAIGEEGPHVQRRHPTAVRSVNGREHCAQHRPPERRLLAWATRAPLPDGQGFGEHAWDRGSRTSSTGCRC